MKTFKNPEVKVVYFGRGDVISTSCSPKDCNCVDCTVCPPGSNDCMYYDTCGDYAQSDGHDANMASPTI